MLEHAHAISLHLLLTGARSTSISIVGEVVIVGACFEGPDHARKSIEATKRLPVGTSHFAVQRDCSRARRNTLVDIRMQPALRRVV